MKVVALFLLYLSTRLINLLILPIFTDESSYLYAVETIKANFLKNWDITLSLPVVKPPLFFLLSMISEIFIKNPLLAGRFVSVVAGGFTLIGLYLLTSRLFNRKAAIVSSLLFITSPFTLTYDRLALMDSLLTTFSVWTFFIAIKCIEKKKIIYLFLLIFFCFLSLLTKQSGKFFLLMLSFVPIILNGKNGFKTALVVFFASIFSYFIYLLLLGRSQYFEFYNNFDKTYINLSTGIILNNSRAIFSWIKSYFPLVFILIPFSILYSLYKSFRKCSVIIYWAFVPIVIAIIVGKYFFPRYLLPSVIFLFPIVAFFLTEIFRKWIFFAVLILILPSLFFDCQIIFDPISAPYHYNERSQFISEWPSGYGLNEAFNKLNSLETGSVIFVEGDNGHLYSSLKLFGANFSIIPFEQNLSFESVKNAAEKKGARYVLLNRKELILDDSNLEKVWEYKRPFNGDRLILFKLL